MRDALGAPQSVLVLGATSDIAQAITRKLVERRCRTVVLAARRPEHLDGFAQGLGDALEGSGARVLVVRPGFVATKMTAGQQPAPLATTADAVADAVVRAMALGREVVYVPGTLRYVFMGLRHLPRKAWRRLPM